VTDKNDTKNDSEATVLRKSRAARESAHVRLRSGERANVTKRRKVDERVFGIIICLNKAIHMVKIYNVARTNDKYVSFGYKYMVMIRRIPMSELFVIILNVIYHLNRKILCELIYTVIIRKIMRNSVFRAFAHADLCIGIDEGPVGILKTVSRFGRKREITLSAFFEDSVYL